MSATIYTAAERRRQRRVVEAQAALLVIGVPLTGLSKAELLGILSEAWDHMELEALHDADCDDQRARAAIAQQDPSNGG